MNYNELTEIVRDIWKNSMDNIDNNKWKNQELFIEKSTFNKTDGLNLNIFP